MSAHVRTSMVTVLLVLAACTVPGAISPTPFAFPTPNLTLTQVLAPTSTGSPVPPTEVVLGSPIATQAPTSPSTTAIAATPTLTSDLERRPNGLVIQANNLLEPPTIDGDLDEWAVPANPIDQVTYGAARWSGEQDGSGTFQLGWDSTNLYLAIRVTDDVFAQVSSGKYLFRGDSLEIQLDADLIGDFTSSVLNVDDFQIGITPGNFGNLAVGMYRWFPASLAGPLLTGSSASVRTSEGYVLEASVPWSAFGLSPNETDAFGFVISLSDNDAAGIACQQTLISSVSTRILTDPTSWGTLLLVGPFQ